MARFDLAYQLVSLAEGGYQKHPSDRGNYNSRGELVGTNWGISAPVLEDYLGYPPNESQMRGLQRSTAVEIYRRRFWNAIKGDQIQNQGVANILFDGRVNHGGTGVRLIQRVLGVDVDGIVGPVTLAAINRANPSTLINAYKDARRRFYEYLVQQDPSQGAFLQGWLNRLNRFVTDNPGTSSGLLMAAVVGGLYLWSRAKG